MTAAGKDGWYRKRGPPSRCTSGPARVGDDYDTSRAIRRVMEWARSVSRTKPAPAEADERGGIVDKHVSTAPRRGTEFTHSSFRRLLPDGTQPFARMRVTAVRCGVVFYTYADDPGSKGAFKMPIGNWIKRYGSAESSPE